MESVLKELAVMLFDIQAVKFGEFKTKTGLKTPVYFDIRVIIAYPNIMSRLAKLLWELRKDSTKIFQVCGVPYTALPLATLISIENNIPMLIKRKEMKSYGTMKMLEGVYLPGDNCIIIEDVITSGSSILETVDILRKEQLNVTQALVIIDREQGARKNLERHKIQVKSLYTVTVLMKYLFEAGKVTQKVVDDVSNYLQANQIQNISVEGMLNDRMKLPYCKRVKLTKNSLTSTLLELMDRKLTNLCLAVDLTRTEKILELANLAGPHIAVLKTHIDIVEDFNENFVRQLKELAKRHEFLLMEDRKFGDIGNTVTLQYNSGIYKIAEWADLITVHPVSGRAVLDALKNGLPKNIKESRGVFLVAEMSCEGALTKGDYLKSAMSMAEEADDLVVGLVCQSNLFSQPGLLQLTPGVKLSKGSDKLGQRYNDPQSVINAGADLIVVGRGITEADDKLAAVLEYKNQLWTAYKQRTQSCDNAEVRDPI
ncbi:uridine 5'-monophosphate synthase [Harpegnathos saltator]|nr:uridine 5'-monophosphate synthase [Harpegnathos saltator]XP_019700292.1 uridine 5'-monophosphate synthase [Harpegnathos saltator]XP_025161055.1 uridine 5'-monophosphate synthase [Harpegnathos saltator]